MQQRKSLLTSKPLYWLTIALFVALFLSLEISAAASKADDESSAIYYAAVLTLLLFGKVLLYASLLRFDTTSYASLMLKFYIASFVPAWYFGIALANVMLIAARFGGGARPFPYSAMVFGQIFGPNYYEFGKPDMFAALIFAVLFDAVALYSLMPPKRMLRKAFYAALAANFAVYGITTIVFLLWLRTPFFA